MLSEESKQILSLFIKFTKARGDGFFEKAQERGPVAIVDEILESGRPVAFVTQAYYDDVQAHREEAEKYLAGLLGMM